MPHAQASLHSRLLAIYLKELVESGLIQVCHIVTGALEHTTLVTEFRGKRGTLMLLWDHVSCWSVVTVNVYVKNEIEGTWLGHRLIMLCARLWRSWRSLV